MKRTLYSASGISVLRTTLAFGHLVEHHISHDFALHGRNFAVLVLLAILAVVAILSLIGAYFLLTAGRQQSSGTTSPRAQD